MNHVVLLHSSNGFEDRQHYVAVIYRLEGNLNRHANLCIAGVTTLKADAFNPFRSSTP